MNINSLGKILKKVSYFLELIIAVLVTLLIVAQIVGLCISVFSDIPSVLNQETFNDLLVRTMTIVVGIEFLKMLYRHDMDSVVEVLLFTLARQLIVNHTSMLDGLICVVAVGGLFAIKKYLSNKSTKEE